MNYWFIDKRFIGSFYPLERMIIEEMDILLIKEKLKRTRLHRGTFYYSFEEYAHYNEFGTLDGFSIL